MAFADLLGQVLQQGLGPQSGQRMQTGMQNLKGMGLDKMVGDLMAGLGGGTTGRPGGVDLASMAKEFLSKPQAGGMTGGQLGGLGALVGALLGGGGGAARGAVGGSALAVLGTLAINALRAHAAAQGGGAPPVTQAEMRQMTSDDTARLLLAAMISAAKADGQIDGQEMSRIMGEAGKDGSTDEERRFLIEEMSRPMDLGALVAAVPSAAVAAQVYAASLVAISVDTPAEKAYLRELAAGLGLDDGTVQRLHASVGAPVA